MRPIPKKLREELSDDPFYKMCCLSNNKCDGRVQWHHALRYVGRQINRRFCILPVCENHHGSANSPLVKEKLDHIMLSRATDEELREFSKAKDYTREKMRLDKKYGIIK